MSRPIVVAAPGSVTLEEDALEPASIVSGSPRTYEANIATTPLPGGHSLVTGIWRCTAGTVTDVEADESFVVLAGHATIEHDGENHELRAGDVCVLPAGAETRWTIHEDLTKVFVMVDED